jgi:hydroxymethylpyrimidine kinase/phosphomethylpyrimidine kinase
MKNSSYILSPTNKISKALTIAGSDSGGGAGIQADLKTFAASRVHGMCVVTSITAQNTLGVYDIQDVNLKTITNQMRAVFDDIGVDAVKTGMLHTSEIIQTIVPEIKKFDIPIVVDPVMVAKSGATLLDPQAIETIKKHLLPLAEVTTPNKQEAEILSGLKISSHEDAELAARKISEIGTKAVVVKGGHIKGNNVCDILYIDGNIEKFENERIETDATHGTGCCFSAAITSELAKGKKISEAVATAKKLVDLAIRFGLKLGRGHGPVNPMAILYKEAEKYSVIRNTSEALNNLQSDPNVHHLIPESQTNLAMSLSYATNLEDIAAIPGRIVRIGDRIHVSSSPKFGASKHVAKTLITVRKYSPMIRAAINIKFSEKILQICKELKLTLSSYDRTQEPTEIKLKEGMTTKWGAEQAIKKFGGVPDVIYHKGDWGKEPMIIILGQTPTDLTKKIKEIASRYVHEFKL